MELDATPSLLADSLSVVRFVKFPMLDGISPGHHHHQSIHQSNACIDDHSSIWHHNGKRLRQLMHRELMHKLHHALCDCLFVCPSVCLSICLCICIVHIRGKFRLNSPIKQQSDKSRSNMAGSKSPRFCGSVKPRPAGFFLHWKDTFSVVLVDRIVAISRITPSDYSPGDFSGVRD